MLMFVNKNNKFLSELCRFLFIENVYKSFVTLEVLAVTLSSTHLKYRKRPLNRALRKRVELKKDLLKQAPATKCSVIKKLPTDIFLLLIWSIVFEI